MKAQFERAPKPHDLKLLRNIVLRLAAPAIILSAIIIAVIGLVWVSIFKRILSFGKSIDYAKLDFFGADANKIIQDFSPYFWWLIGIAGTLIVIRILFALVKSVMQRSRYKAVDQNSFNQLSQQLSVPALDVLLWAWSDHDEPVRLGDLKQAKDELAHGKSIRMYRALEQRQTLEQAKQALINKNADDSFTNFDNNKT